MQCASYSYSFPNNELTVYLATGVWDVIVAVTCGKVILMKKFFAAALALNAESYSAVF